MKVRKTLSEAIIISTSTVSCPRRSSHRAYCSPSAEIGFDWLCFSGRPVLLGQKRMKLALFGANDDTATARSAPGRGAGCLRIGDRSAWHTLPGQIGFDWVCFFCSIPIFSPETLKLGSFGAITVCESPRVSWYLPAGRGRGGVEPTVLDRRSAMVLYAQVSFSIVCSIYIIPHAAPASSRNPSRRLRSPEEKEG